MQMVVTVQVDALVKGFARVAIVAIVGVVAVAAAVGGAAAAAAAAEVVAAPVAPAPAGGVVAVVALAAASSEGTSETLPLIFRHFLQSTNKEKKDQINFVEFYLWNDDVKGRKKYNIQW